MVQALVVGKSSLDLYADFVELLKKAGRYGQVWIDTEYWSSSVVYIVRSSNVFNVGHTSRPGYVAYSRDGLVLVISDDLSYISIESIHQSICEA